MLEYRSWLRTHVLLLAGKTKDNLLDDNSTISSKRDEVDKLIARNAVDLDDRFVKVFGLLYECHSERQVAERLKQKNNKTLSLETVRRYSSDSKRRLFDIIRNRPKEIESLEKLLTN